uniref:Alpha-adducin n=1 Tax=Cyprinus carpio TaxID=7962 RepID=A0A8C2IVS8_CYPCA
MVTPVNDLRGSDSIAYEKGEKLLRCKLAAFYRLADLFGWSQLIYNHLTVRLNSEQERFLIVPFGLLYSEVTASSLVKINLQGEIVDRGSTNLGVNQAGFTLHSAIYAARPDIKCIVHIHTAAGAAVSAMKCGLLPISPEALSLGEVSYHDYHGILVDDEERVLIQKNLGPKSKVMILRNHGLVSVGETVEEAFYYIHNLVTACEIQVRTLASSGGPDNLIMLDPSKYKSRPRHLEPVGDGSGSHPNWQIGEQEFEALMRMLDNLGYRTGYPYRCPALRDKAKKYSDVEIPPSATSYSYAEDSDSGARSPLKHSFQRQQRDKNRWLASESAEEGQDGSPKAKTKWTKEDSLRQAAVANQFVPLNTNPKEVQEMRNKIREQNLQDKKTAGPQSQVLTGAVVDRSYVQGELVTASKAIIEKEYQPRVVVSKTGPNPFNKLTDHELEEYRKEVELKQKGTEGKNTNTVRSTRVSSQTLKRMQRMTCDAIYKCIYVQKHSLSTCAFSSSWLRHNQEMEMRKTHSSGLKFYGPSRAHERWTLELIYKLIVLISSSTEAQLEQTFKDETLPDLTPDEVFEDPALPAEDPAPEQADPAPQSEGEEPVAGDDAAGDHGSDESPNKSPSKKKKKFRTPSFLKKNKKKSETQ